MQFLHPDKEPEEDESDLDYMGAEPIDPKEVNLKQNDDVNIRGDYGILSDYDENGEKEDGREEGVDGDGIVDHEEERRSAKYSRDLNHDGFQQQQRHLHGNQPGAHHHGDGSEVRNKILTGMKKIMQSLTGVSEEDSERMLVELGRDPKAGDVKDKLKVMIII